ncbi:type II toxin-antitoxin system VapC family toxin [candidate division KSB1 bacterium]|nr:type II toxin-antitoxin system VapC family toxin [candidate division KSB1 bacterium]
MKILLDTNAYGKLLTGDVRVLNELAKADTVYMSVIVLGELYAGFKGGGKEIENRKKLEIFLNKPTVNQLNATQNTAEAFGHIKNEMKRAGTPLPINDVWIAAHVFETGSILITYDRHFLKIKSIRIWNVLTS